MTPQPVARDIARALSEAWDAGHSLEDVLALYEARARRREDDPDPITDSIPELRRIRLDVALEEAASEGRVPFPPQPTGEDRGLDRFEDWEGARRPLPPLETGHDRGVVHLGAPGAHDRREGCAQGRSGP